jgi:predicted N-acetyltransferase YhbS
MPTPTVRPYVHSLDFAPVGRLLIESHLVGDRPRTWPQPRWEYMHFHPNTLALPIERFGVAEQDGRIVGVVHFEDRPAYAYLQVRPGHGVAIGPLLDWAGQHLGGPSIRFGPRTLGIFVNEHDHELRDAVTDRGFVAHPEVVEESSGLDLGRPLPRAVVPRGFRLRSLAEEDDLWKVNRVLWRGFGHGEQAPATEVPGRAFAQAAPGFRRDLTIVAVEPGGEYATFCGMWFVPENALAYVEPVATDPAFRRLGLGRAAVLESLRRVRVLGARVAWVGSDIPFYRSLGFELRYRSPLWVKSLRED